MSAGSPTDRLAGLTHRDADWADLAVLVTGLGVSGFAAADALLERGARVTVVDGAEPAPGSPMAERARTPPRETMRLPTSPHGSSISGARTPPG